MATTATQSYQPGPETSAPAGQQGEYGFLKINAGIEAAQFEKTYVQDKEVGLLIDGGDGNPDKQVVRLRQIAVLAAQLPSKDEKKRVTKSIVAEAMRINKEVKEQSEKNAAKNITEHPGFLVPEPVIEEVKAFFNGKGDLSDTYYSQNATGDAWQPREMGNIDRDETGMADEKVHIEQPEGMSGVEQTGPDFVQPICSEVNATPLLEAVFRNAKDEQAANAFSAAVDPRIKEAANKAGFETDLMLSMTQARVDFMTYAMLSYAILGVRKQGGPKVDEVLKVANSDRDSWKERWSREIETKGYPPQWKELFARLGDEKAQGVRTEAGEMAVPFTDADVRALVRRDTYPDFDQDKFNKNVKLAKEMAPFIAAVAQQTIPNATDGSKAQSSASSTPSTFSDCVRVSTLPGRTTEDGEVCGWRPWGSGFRFIVRVSKPKMLPEIYRFRVATKDEVDTYRQTGSAVEIPSFHEVEKDDLKELKGRDPRTINFHGIATQEDLNEKSTRNQTLILFRGNRDEPSQRLRMVWGSQFESCVKPKKDAKATIREAYNLGMGINKEIQVTPIGKDKSKTRAEPGSLGTTTSQVPDNPPPAVEGAAAFNARLDKMEEMLKMFVSAANQQSAQNGSKPTPT